MDDYSVVLKVLLKAVHLVKALVDMTGNSSDDLLVDLTVVDLADHWAAMSDDYLAAKKAAETVGKKAD